MNARKQVTGAHASEKEQEMAKGVPVDTATGAHDSVSCALAVFVAGHARDRVVRSVALLARIVAVARCAQAVSRTRFVIFFHVNTSKLCGNGPLGRYSPASFLLGPDPRDLGAGRAGVHRATYAGPSVELDAIHQGSAA